jgi:glycosyltransferase involved in cell wall biosynthesis
MESVFNQENVTCIIPFYDEEVWTLRIIVFSLLAIPEINQIILVDDGSKSKKVYNAMVRTFKHRYPVKILRIKSNIGKSSAVSFALNKAYNKNILLVDSDLEDVRISEFKMAIKKFKEESLEMVILKRIKSLPLVKLFRSNTLFSGERIINKNQLSKILATGVKGFQLEIAINQYFIDKKLQNKCGWSPSSAVNNYKFKKIGFLKGLYKDYKMYNDLIKYVGLRNYVNQVFNFCK